MHAVRIGGVIFGAPPPGRFKPFRNTTIIHVRVISLFNPGDFPETVSTYPMPCARAPSGTSPEFSYTCGVGGDGVEMIENVIFMLEDLGIEDLECQSDFLSLFGLHVPAKLKILQNI